MEWELMFPVLEDKDSVRCKAKVIRSQAGERL